MCLILAGLDLYFSSLRIVNGYVSKLDGTGKRFFLNFPFVAIRLRYEHVFSYLACLK